MTRYVPFFLGLVIIVLFHQEAQAYSDYYTTVPNGNRFGCGMCHVADAKPQGAATFVLNAFGRDYQRLAIPAGSIQRPKWNLDLAKIDSDGDGYTNGEELQEITGDSFVWEPRQINLSEWDLAAGVPTLARNPGDPTLSIPGFAFNAISPSSYTINVGDRLEVPFSAKAQVPGRAPNFELVGQNKDLQGLRLLRDLPEETQGLKTLTARIVWTPADTQGGDFTIGIQATDGTAIPVQTIRVSVLGGINEPPPPPPPPPPIVIKITDYTATSFDFDGSLVVDLPDFTVFASHYGESATVAGPYDFDKSGTVDWRDFLFFTFFYGKRINNDIYHRTPAGDQVAYVPVKGGSYVQQIDGLFQQITVLAHDMGKYEITNRQYRNFLTRNNNTLALTPQPYNNQSFDDRATALTDHPVIGVSWEMADKYCKWAGGRLPTQTEWNFAARGTGLRPYAPGQTLSPSQANYANSGDPYEPGTTPVGFYDGRVEKNFQTKESFSLYGAYDMTGNVWEWCGDVRSDVKPNQAPIKGGSYSDAATSTNITLNSVQWLEVIERRENLGFRCLVDK